MSFRDITVQPECHITSDVYGFGTASSNDSGCTRNGKHSTVWDVQLTGKPTGRGSNCCSTWSFDPAAVYAFDRRHMDTELSDDFDRRKTVSDE